jgi:molecular chaperone Hsp33
MFLSELQASRLYSFLDTNKRYNLHFFDGQKLIQDLLLLHHLKARSFQFYREFVLSFIPLIAFLKNGESLGIYIDSEEPYFRLKIETNFAGHTRTLLLPHEFDDFPQQLTGVARVTKQFPHGHLPYTSLVEYNRATPEKVLNLILDTSYQAQAKIVVSEVSDQSCLFVKLPPPQANVVIDMENLSLPPINDYAKKHRDFLQSVFEVYPNNTQSVVEHFEKLTFAYLSSRQVEFYCPCSRENMINYLLLLSPEDQTHVFDENGQANAKCDYCLKNYVIHKIDLQKPDLIN